MTVILKVIVGLFVLFVVGLLGLFFAVRIMVAVEKSRVPEMTPEKAQKLFERAGGVNEINREASALLNQWGGDNFKILYESELTKSPAIYSLYTNCETYSGEPYSGTSVAVWYDFPNDNTDGKHVWFIKIEFGNHELHKRFYIFNPNQPVTFNMPSNWFQVTSNIFASK